MTLDGLERPLCVMLHDT